MRLVVCPVSARDITIVVAAHLCALLLGPAASAQAPINLEYLFSQSDNLRGSSNNIQLRTRVDGVTQPFNSMSIQHDDLLVTISTEISANRRTASFSSIEFFASYASPSFDGEFDLGFDGKVPFRLTVRELEFHCLNINANLAINLNFDETFSFCDGTLTTVFEVLGNTETVVETHQSGINLRGTFIPTPDLSEVAIEIYTEVAATFDNDAFNLNALGHSLELQPNLRLVLDLRGSAESDAPPPPIPDADGDDVPDIRDNCPDEANSDQLDRDFDFVGDACDPFPDDRDNEQAECEADLLLCQISPVFVDTDGDGEDDSTDSCPATPAAQEVDGDGCSLDQFCGLVDASDRTGSRVCKKSDWKNDEPIMKSRDRDCTVDRGDRGREDDRCVPSV